MLNIEKNDFSQILYIYERLMSKIMGCSIYMFNDFPILQNLLKLVECLLGIKYMFQYSFIRTCDDIN